MEKVEAPTAAQARQNRDELASDLLQLLEHRRKEAFQHGANTREAQSDQIDIVRMAYNHATDVLNRLEEEERQRATDQQVAAADQREARLKTREHRFLIAQTIAGLALVAITYWYAALTSRLVGLNDRALRAQVVPSVELVIPNNSTSVIVANDGPYPIVDLDLTVDDATLSPDGRPVSMLRSSPRVPGEPPRSWWHLDRLGPGQHETRSLAEKAEEALRNLEITQSVQAKGGLVGVTADAPLYEVLAVRLTYRRDVDGKLYSETKHKQVTRVSNTRQPLLWSDDRGRLFEK